MAYSESIKSFIRLNAAYFTDEQLAAKLTELTGEYFDKFSVQSLRHRMGVAKKRGAGKCELDNR